MTVSTVAKRYSLALFQIVKESQALDKVEDELRVIKEVLVSNSELAAVLESPKLTIEAKKELIKEAFTSVNPYVLNTLMLLIDRHRGDQIAEVADGFFELANDERGIAEAKIYSIRPLTDSEKEGLSSTFAARVGKKSLRIENIVDSNLLGGIKLRIGNRIYDGSLKGKLDRLERKLLG